MDSGIDYQRKLESKCLSELDSYFGGEDEEYLLDLWLHAMLRDNEYLPRFSKHQDKLNVAECAWMLEWDEYEHCFTRDYPWE